MVNTGRKILGQKRFKPATRKVARQRSRQEVRDIIAKAFRANFPNDTVDVSDGYKDNIHVLVVSSRFEKMTEKKKQDWMWSILDGTDLTKQEKLLVSLLYPVSPSEIK